MKIIKMKAWRSLVFPVISVANRNRVVTKESIADYLWGEYGGGYGSYDFVYTHLKNLRRKLQEAGCPDYVQNIYGIGYKFSLDRNP